MSLTPEEPRIGSVSDNDGFDNHESDFVAKCKALADKLGEVAASHHSMTSEYREPRNMTSGERESLGRLRRYSAGGVSAFTIWNLSQDQHSDLWEAKYVDLTIASHIALREHLADDDEFLDSTWIDGMNLLWPGDKLRFYCHSGQWEAWFATSTKLRDVNTRGDVRRLCRALGVDV